jgi:hypothetical protein
MQDDHEDWRKEEKEGRKERRNAEVNGKHEKRE